MLSLKLCELLNSTWLFCTQILRIFLSTCSNNNNDDDHKDERQEQEDGHGYHFWASGEESERASISLGYMWWEVYMGGGGVIKLYCTQYGYQLDESKGRERKRGGSYISTLNSLNVPNILGFYISKPWSQVWNNAGCMCCVFLYYSSCLSIKRRAVSLGPLLRFLSLSILCSFFFLVFPVVVVVFFYSSSTTLFAQRIIFIRTQPEEENELSK